MKHKYKAITLALSMMASSQAAEPSATYLRALRAAITNANDPNDKPTETRYVVSHSKDDSYNKKTSAHVNLDVVLAPSMVRRFILKRDADQAVEFLSFVMYDRLNDIYGIVDKGVDVEVRVYSQGKRSGRIYIGTYRTTAAVYKTYQQSLK